MLIGGNRAVFAQANAPTSRNPLTEMQFHITPIHPRMPVILHARDYDSWLDREETERLPLDLLRPFESEAMEMYAANPKVENVRNKGPELMRAALKAAESGELPL